MSDIKCALQSTRARVVSGLLVGLVAIGSAFQYLNRVRVAEAEALPQARLLRAIAETRTGYIEVDAKTQAVKFMDEQATELLGYEESELDGKPLGVIMPPWFREAHSKMLAAGVSHIDTGTGPRIIIGKCSIVRKDGTTVDVVLRMHIAHMAGLFVFINRASESKFSLMTEDGQLYAPSPDGHGLVPTVRYQTKPPETPKG